MGYTVPFNNREELLKFLEEKKKHYGVDYDIWLEDYAIDNRIYIASEDKFIPYEEIEELANDDK